jgi:hypothetical protein
MVEDAATYVRAQLGLATERDWSKPAGEVTWSCLRTADHMGDALASYAAQLATRATSGWEPSMRPEEWPDATPTQLLAALGPLASVLSEVAQATPSYARAWHAFGASDSEGFCAMACDELLVHGGDIAQGLGLPWSPPSAIAQATFERLFPEFVATPTDDAWTVLWWANGRAAAPARARRIGAWSWQAVPFDV